jgi:hypothetical protein
MKAMLISGVLLVLFGSTAFSQTTFEKHFSDQTLRIDYFHIGDAKEEFVTLDRLYRYGIWAGSRKHLIDNFNNGKYYIQVFDSTDKELLFSRGFDSYFGEYQTSAEAAKGIKRTYHESALIPMPKSKVIFKLLKRDEMNNLGIFFQSEIDPDDVMIISESFSDPDIRIIDAHKSGDPHKCLDIVILGEGYKADEQNKFEQDLVFFSRLFLKHPPYSSYIDRINIYGVLKPSLESGIDEPRAGIFKNTALGFTFNSLGSERYVMTEDNRTLRNVAASVPYDAIYVMVNHKRYGGGGIQNLYCSFTTDNQWREYLFLHEFGHSFAGLADEYYTSASSYIDFYPKGVEPYSPNITALLNPDQLKWKDLVTPGIEIPTPWKKADYDRTDLVWQKKRREMNDEIARLKRTGAAPKKIREAERAYDVSDSTHAMEMKTFLEKSAYAGKVGAFEGAGYVSEGLYRPMIDCIMFSKTQLRYCKVCERSIEQVINFYLE